MVTTQFFGVKIARYLREHGIDERTLAQVAAKAYRNGALNPNAWRREPMGEEITAADMVNDPLTQYMFCSPGEGGAAIVVASEAAPTRLGRAGQAARRRTRTRRSARSRCSAPRSRGPAAPERQHRRRRGRFRGGGRRPRRHRRRAAAGHRERRGDHAPRRVRLLRARRAGGVVAAGETEIGGRLPVNTDGGCIANGEPIGASGLRQVHEIVTQLRGEAGDRQVAGARGWASPTSTARRASARARSWRSEAMTVTRTRPDLDDFAPTPARGWRRRRATRRRPVGRRRRTRSPSSRTGRPRRSARRPTGSAPTSRRSSTPAGARSPGPSSTAAATCRRRTPSPSGSEEEDSTCRGAPRCSR